MTDIPTSIPDYLSARERAKASTRVVQVLCVVLAIGCIAGAGALIKPMNWYRAKAQMRLRKDVRLEVPPDIALLNSMLGPFRGLWITALWIQADQLKQESRFYDALQRAEWICKLQPRMANVWGFQAWNMAYNISVTKHTPEERWRWVTNGAHLLQLQGIPLNPRNIGLYKELSWIYFHKIGDIMDDMHWSYKRELAAEYEKLLGAPDMTWTTEQQIDAFRPIGEAPDTLRELREQPGIDDFLNRLRKIGYEPDLHMLEDLHRATALDERMATLKSRQTATVTDAQKALLALCRDGKLADPCKRVLAWARARALRQRHGMDPKWMLKCMEQFGPLDWRVPESHAIYWGYLGDERTMGIRTRRPSIVTNNRRVILFALMNLFFKGRLLFMIDLDHANQSDYFQMSDLRMVDYVQKNFLEFGRREEGPDVTATSMSFSQAHQLVMHQAILALYIRGTLDPEDMAKARKYYEFMREHYRQPDGSVHPRYGQRLEDFINYLLTSFTDTQRNTIALLSELTDTAFLALAQGDANGYRAYMRNAREVYDRYMAGKESYREARSKLQTYPRLVGRMLFNFLVAEPVPTFYKGSVWHYLMTGTPQETDLLRMIFDQSRDYLSPMCDAEGFDVDKLFPQPPDMDEYRKAHVDDKPFPDPFIPEPRESASGEAVKPPEIVKPKGLEK